MALEISLLKKTIVGAVAGAVALTGGYLVSPKNVKAQDRGFAGISIPLSRSSNEVIQGTRIEVGYAHLNNNGNIGFSGEVFVTPSGKTFGVAGDIYSGTEDAGISGGVEVGYDIPNHKFQEALRAAVQVQKGTANLGVKLPFSGVMKPNLSGLECTLGLGTPKWDKDSDPDTTNSGSTGSPPPVLF